MNPLGEAFKSLKSIMNEDIFDLSVDDGKEELKDFLDNDEDDEILSIIDDEAETEEELQDSYIGKVICDCNVCHSLIYKDPSEVFIDEESQVANIEEDCPFCYSTGDGFKVVGQVKPFVQEEEEKEEVKIDDDGEEVEVNEKTEMEDKLKESLKKRLREHRNTRIRKPLKEGKSAEQVRREADGIEKRNCDIAGDMNECDEKPLNESAEEMGSAVADNGKKVMAVGTRRHTRTYNYEDVTFRYGDATGKGSYRWQNRPWQKFDFEEALRDAMISAGIDDVFADRVLDNSHSLEGAVEWFAENIDKEDSLKESIEDMHLTTDDGTELSMTSGEDGEITITTKPGHGVDEDALEGETIGDIDLGTEIEIENNKREDEIKDEVDDDIEEINDDVDVDEFDEESFDELGESYLKKVYGNVQSFKSTDVYESGRRLYIEGVIKFASGKQKKTNFVFENMGVSKNGSTLFEGYNKEIARGKKSFRLNGKVKGNKVFSESLSYRYNQNKNRVQGIVKKG